MIDNASFIEGIELAHWKEGWHLTREKIHMLYQGTA